MSEHTPGPWKYGHKGFDALWVGPDYDQVPTAIVPWDCDDARASARENAKLIAAAPDMLAALKDAAVRLAGAGMLGGEDDPVVAAITNARG